MALSRKLLFIGIAAIPFGIACNGIIGLSDFQYGECPGARCGDAGFDDLDNFVPETFVPDARVPDSGPGADPVSWAQWPMPNYPEAGVGAVQALTVNGDEVKDEVTKLTWRKQTAGNGLSYDDAVKACKAIASGTWRLPKRVELVTLLDFSRPDPEPRIARAFGDVVFSAWTSSEYRTIDGVQPAYWAIDFSTGVVVHKTTANFQLAALCVKAGP